MTNNPFGSDQSLPLDLPPASILPDVVVPVDSEGDEAQIGYVLGIVEVEGVKTVAFIPVSTNGNGTGLPTSVRGDILVGVTGGGWARLPIGNVETVLISGGQTPYWGALTKAQLPTEIAYEDEANIFLLDQTIQAELIVEAVQRPLITITPSQSPYTIVRSSWHVNAFPSTNDVVVRLPDAVANYVNGKSAVFTVKKTAPNRKHQVTINTVVAGQMIDGFTTAAIRTPFKSLTFVTDGSDWFIQ